MGDAWRPGAGGEFARLSRAESLRLLAAVPVGRLIFTVNALPASRPPGFGRRGRPGRGCRGMSAS
jgi:hypothetical protein